MSRINPMETTISLREHLTNIRKNVDPANCARTPKQASEAAKASWSPKARKKRALAVKARQWAKKNS